MGGLSTENKSRLARLSPRTRRRLVAYPALFLGYLLLMTFGGCADRLILYPSARPVAAPGAQRVQLQSPGGGVLEVWSARSPGAAKRDPAAHVLVFCGNADRAEWRVLANASVWGDRPVEAWAVNYPGYGGSAGPARLKAIPPAALAAFDALAARADGKPIFLDGMSLGTAAALHVAANRPAAGLLLYNPPPLRQLILQRHGWWNLWLVAWPVSAAIPSELDSTANGKKATAPAVFVLAGRDNVVPPAYQQMVVDAYAGEKRLIRMAAAGHNDAPDDVATGQLEANLDWLWEKALGAPPTPPASRPPAP